MIQVLLITQSDCIGCEIMTDIILSIKKTYDDNKNININICNKDYYLVSIYYFNKCPIFSFFTFK